MSRNLNICLHNVVENEDQIQSIYDITESQLIDMNTLLKTFQGNKYDAYTFYFDDGYKSFNDIVSKTDLGLTKERIRCAIIVDEIDLPNRLTTQQIRTLSREGYGIDSHGTSHAALASFDEGRLLATALGGIYRNRPYGQEGCLTKQEVLFQLHESQQSLEDILGENVTDFVLPYGLYNSQTLEIIASKTTYKKILTCHAGIDTGRILAPRLLITQENINDIKNIINDLNEDYELLTES